MATTEEMQKQIDDLTAAQTGWETEKTILASQVGELTTRAETADAALIVSQKEPGILKFELDTLKDSAAKHDNEKAELNTRVEAFATMESNLAEANELVKTMKANEETLTARVRTTLVGHLVNNHSLREDNLKDKPLSALEAIADALSTQTGSNKGPGDGNPGTGLKDGPAGGGQIMTSHQVAMKELEALGMKTAEA